MANIWIVLVSSLVLMEHGCSSLKDDFVDPNSKKGQALIAFVKQLFVDQEPDLRQATFFYITAEVPQAPEIDLNLVDLGYEDTPKAYTVYLSMPDGDRCSIRIIEKEGVPKYTTEKIDCHDGHQ